VKELREKLAEYQDDMRVVVNGYEGGVDDDLTVVEVRLKLNVHNEWYYGDHEILTEGFDEGYSSGEPALHIL
jgi:hypothetical protein